MFQYFAIVFFISINLYNSVLNRMSRVLVRQDQRTMHEANVDVMVKTLSSHKVKDALSLNFNKLIFNIEQNNLKEIANCLQQDKNLINNKNSCGETSLIIAAKLKKIDIFKLLFENGANLKEKDVFGRDAAFYSVINNDFALANFLLSNDIDLNIKFMLPRNYPGSFLAYFENRVEIKFLKYFHNRSLLEISIVKDYLKIAELILNKYPEYKNKKSINELLLFAMKYGSLASIELLLRYCDNINFLNNKGQNLLMLLLQENKTNTKKIVDLLVNKGINLKHRDNDNRSIVEYIHEISNDEKCYLLEILIDNKIDIHLPKDKNGDTFLLSAVKQNDLKTVHFLLSKDIYVNAKDQNDNTALMIAVKNDLRRMIYLLLSDCKVKVNTFNNKENKSAYDYAQDDFVKQLLIDNGAQLTVFQKISLYKKLLIVVVSIYGLYLLNQYKNKKNQKDKELIKQKFLLNIDQKDENGQTILIKAVKANLIDLVKILINVGAKLEIKDNNGKSALNWAVETNNDLLVNLLLKIN